MQIFFFDTETTGFEYKDRIIQMGAIYGLYDEETKIFHTERIINQIINCVEESNPGALAVHGITKERQKPFKTITAYIKEFISYMNKSDLIVCHNVGFDMRMLQQEIDRCLIDKSLLKERKLFDTMKDPKILDFMGQGTKRPKLHELYTRLFNKGFDDAHDALADITATKDCFFELLNKNIISL